MQQPSNYDELALSYNPNLRPEQFGAVSLRSVVEDMQGHLNRQHREASNMSAIVSALDMHMKSTDFSAKTNGFDRMKNCRKALQALDRRGWERSYHQKTFHDQYIRACSRIFFKSDAPGEFDRAHQKILEINGWDSLPQEILVSTPRRFGKTISVSMFAAAMMFACPKMELSIYSTCKRISQKLLRNVSKFLELIFMELNIQPFKVLRQNQEEVHVQGNEGFGDIRVINSYPSKVRSECQCQCLCCVPLSCYSSLLLSTSSSSLSSSFLLPNNFLYRSIREVHVSEDWSSCGSTMDNTRVIRFNFLVNDEVTTDLDLSLMSLRSILFAVWGYVTLVSLSMLSKRFSIVKESSMDSISLYSVN